jgi:hypothetical protein
VAGAELTLVAPRFSITTILLPTAAKEPVRGADKAGRTLDLMGARGRNGLIWRSSSRFLMALKK